MDLKMTIKTHGARFVTAILLFTAANHIQLYAQGENKHLRHGNRSYSKGDYQDSEINYRRALEKNEKSDKAVFNIGDALYRQNKYDEAVKQFTETYKMNDDPLKRSASLYNLGNSLLSSDKVGESIDAYKNSLKLNPDNMEAKYNLAYAQDLLKQQEQQQQQQQDQNQDKEQDNKDENRPDKEDQNGRDNEEGQQEQQQQQQQQGKQSISKEDAERLLNALANDEKNIQEKVKLAKAMKARVQSVKNW